VTDFMPAFFLQFMSE